MIQPKFFSAILYSLCLVPMGMVQVQGGEIEQLHRKWVRPREQDTSAQMRRFEGLMEEAKHGVTEIGLERTPCYGTCPAYCVVFQADGAFRYEGIQFVQRKGKRTGRIPQVEFDQLCEFILQVGYMKLQATYDLPVSDLPSTYTLAMVNGQRKLVKNVGDSGPVTLWAIQAAIDGVLAHAEWDGEAKPEFDPDQP